MSAAWGTDYAPSGQFEKMFNTDLGAGVGTGVAQIAVDKPMDITSSLSKIFLLLPQRKML